MSGLVHPAAIVLAGGRGSRMGGADKAELTLGGARLIDRVVAALNSAGITRIAVVGPEHAAPEATIPAQEAPRFGGPLAALAAGLAALAAAQDQAAPEPPDLLLLSCDLANPDAIVARLRAKPLPTGVDGVVLRDPDGRAQWLAGRYRCDALREAVGAPGAHLAERSLRSAFGDLRLELIDAPADDVADIDTPADLEAARSALDARSGPAAPSSFSARPRSTERNEEPR